MLSRLPVNRAQRRAVNIAEKLNRRYLQWILKEAAPAVRWTFDDADRGLTSEELPAKIGRRLYDLHEGRLLYDEFSLSMVFKDFVNSFGLAPRLYVHFERSAARGGGIRKTVWMRINTRTEEEVAKVVELLNLRTTNKPYRVSEVIHAEKWVAGEKARLVKLWGDRANVLLRTPAGDPK